MLGIKKALSCVISVFLVLCAFTSATFAEEVESPLLIVNGNDVYEFDCLKDYMLFEQARNLDKNNRSDGWDYISYGPEYIGSESYVFARFDPNTPNWAKASSYSVSYGHSFTFSFMKNYKGYTFNIGGSFTQGVTTTIPADSSRYSRLALFTDLSFYRTRIDAYEYGVFQYTYYANSAIVTSSYLDPKYQ